MVKNYVLLAWLPQCLETICSWPGFLDGWKLWAVGLFSGMVGNHVLLAWFPQWMETLRSLLCFVNGWKLYALGLVA